MTQISQNGNVKQIHLTEETISLLVKACPLNVDISQYLESILEEFLKKVGEKDHIFSVNG